LFKPENL
jgi:hypothetical protein